MSTTISCRFFAPAAALLFALSAVAPADAQTLTQPMTAAQRQRARARMRPPQQVPDLERWSTLMGETSVAPLIADQLVFAFRPPTTIAAFALEDGKEMWTAQLAPEYPLVVDGDRLFVFANEAMHALNAATGAIGWRQPTGVITAPPLIHQGWVITITAGEVVARRAADGTVVWQQPNGAQRLRPTIDGDTLYLSLADGTVLALDLTTGARVWERKFRGATSEVAVLGKRVYVGSEDKFFYCLDADNGRVEWRSRPGAAVIGRPVVDAHRVYFAAMDNQVRALDRVDGATEWQGGLQFRPSSGPLLFGTALVVPGGVEHLRTFDAATGKTGRAITFPAPLASPLSIHPSPKGPLAATITGGLDTEWKLSLWEPAMAVPVAPLTLLPGKVAPLLPALPTAVVGGT